MSLSCSDDGHPPVADDGLFHPDGEAGNSSGPSGDGGSDGGGEPMTDPGAPEPGELNPKYVYVYGSIDPSSDERDVVFHYSTPDQYFVGFGSGVYGGSAVLDGSTVLYSIGLTGEIHRFSPEGYLSDTPDVVEYPADPTADDPVVERPGCKASLERLDSRLITYFLVNTEGRLIYYCPNDEPPAWYEGSDLVYSGDAGLLALGPGDLALSYAGTLQLSDPENVHPLEGVTKIMAGRSNGDGFLIADATGSGTDLLEVAADGATKRLGTYPEIPPNIKGPCLLFSTQCSVIAADKSLVQLSTRFDIDDFDVVIRRTLSGKREVVYDEYDGPISQIVGNSGLVTGP